MNTHNFVAVLQISIILALFNSVITTNDCNINVKMQQVLHNDGFHR